MQTDLRGSLVWIDWELPSVFEAANLIGSPAEHRMNAIENLATRLTAPWRKGKFSLAEHLRFALSTQPELLAWIMLRGGDSDSPRLKMYESSVMLIDNRVPHGMLRVLL